MNRARVVTQGKRLRRRTSGWLAMARGISVALALTPVIVGKRVLPACGLRRLAIRMNGHLGLIDPGIRGSVGRHINRGAARTARPECDEGASAPGGLFSLPGLVALGVSFFAARHLATLFPTTLATRFGEVQTILPLIAAGLWLALLNAVMASRPADPVRLVARVAASRARLAHFSRASSAAATLAILRRAAAR